MSDELLEKQLEVLHQELYDVYHDDPRAYTLIGKYWMRIDILEDSLRFKANRSKREVDEQHGEG